LEPDAQLVQDCLRGDGPSWEELVRRNARRVFNLCYRFTGNATELQGVVRSFPDLADQRDEESAGGPLPADEAGPADGFDRR
jgi:hypothetical protein